MRRLVVLGMLLLCCCSDTTTLTRCGAPCWDGAPEHQDVGLCKSGVWACDDRGTPTDCVGQVSPTSEQCDGKDNDCDGFTDELPDLIPKWGSRCASDIGACRAGYWACSSTGAWTCVDSVGPRPERCDGIDNDCDGYIDEASDLPVEFCYTGDDPSTALIPPCRPGVRACIGAHWVCTGDVIATPEVCEPPDQPQIDNDCDGYTDDVPTSTATDPTPVDIVLIVDRSGSMCSPIMRVRQAINTFVNNRSGDRRYRFWLFDLPGVVDGVAAPHPTCHPSTIPPLQPCSGSILQNATRALSCTHGGSEPAYDILYDIVVGVQEIAWSPNGRRYIMLFTDEGGQSRHLITEDDVAQAIAGKGITFYGFVNYGRTNTLNDFRDDYDDIAQQSGGQLYDLFLETPDLIAAFGAVAQHPCNMP